MKAWICLACALLLAMGMSTTVAEEGAKSTLGDFAGRLLKSVNTAADPSAAEKEDEGVSFGPSLRVDDPFFQKIRSSAYLLEDKYSKEANVMIELKNVSGRTLYPKQARVTACRADGTVIDEETYSDYGPEMVEDGKSLFVWDWFYGFDAPVAEIAYFEVVIETETSAYKTYKNIDAQALVQNGIAYALIENKTESDIYGLNATIAIENEQGVLLDVCEISTGNACGIFPGSVMILRDNAKDYSADQPLNAGTATAYAQYELD